MHMYMYSVHRVAAFPDLPPSQEQGTCICIYACTVPFNFCLSFLSLFRSLLAALAGAVCPVLPRLSSFPFFPPLVPLSLPPLPPPLFLTASKVNHRTDMANNNACVLKLLHVL